MPRIQNAGYLRALVCHFYAQGMRPEDYAVLARRSDLSAMKVTELLKTKSACADDLRIAQDKLVAALSERQRNEADLRIFLADNSKPEPRKVLWLFNSQTKEMRDYDKHLNLLQDRLARSTAKMEEVQAFAKVKQALSDRAINDFHAQEIERDSLRDAAVRAGIYLMFHHQSSGSYGEAVKAFEDARNRARGDRRLYVSRVFVEALTEGSNAATSLLHEFNDAFAGGTAPEAALALALIRAASDVRLTPRDLPPVTPENYSAPAHFALHCVLAAWYGLAAGGKAGDGYDLFTELAQGWFSGTFSAKALSSPLQWQAELPRTELMAAAHLKSGQPNEVLGIFGIELERLQTSLAKRRGEELVRLTFGRISDARLGFGPVYSEMGERCICLMLLALLETAPKEFCDIVRQELRVANCGNIYELLRAREESREPRFRRVPEETYWET